MRDFQEQIKQIEAVSSGLPPDDHSNEVKSARQLLGWAVDNLSRAPSDVSVALSRLESRYAEKQLGRYVVNADIAVTLTEGTAGKLASALIVFRMGAVPEDEPTVRVDDAGLTFDIPYTLISEHQEGYMLAYASVLSWYRHKRQEILNSDDPLSVGLD